MPESNTEEFHDFSCSSGESRERCQHRQADIENQKQQSANRKHGRAEEMSQQPTARQPERHQDQRPGPERGQEWRARTRRRTSQAVTGDCRNHPEQDRHEPVANQQQQDDKQTEYLSTIAVLDEEQRPDQEHQPDNNSGNPGHKQVGDDSL
jgi:hypothetical protein